MIRSGRPQDVARGGDENTAEEEEGRENKKVKRKRKEGRKKKKRGSDGGEEESESEMKTGHHHNNNNTNNTMRCVPVPYDPLLASSLHKPHRASRLRGRTHFDHPHESSPRAGSV